MPEVSADPVMAAGAVLELADVRGTSGLVLGGHWPRGRRTACRRSGARRGVSGHMEFGRAGGGCWEPQFLMQGSRCNRKQRGLRAAHPSLRVQQA